MADSVYAAGGAVQQYHKGDIFLADLGKGIGNEVSSTRPVVILSGNHINKFSHIVLVAPVNNNSTKRGYQSRVDVGTDGTGLRREGQVMVEHLRAVDIQRLKEYIGRVPRRTLVELNTAILSATGVR